jgi:hypothetical protein
MPRRSLRVVDYRGTIEGQFLGVPWILGTAVSGIALTGPALDAILPSAQAAGMDMRSSRGPLSDLAGRGLGPTVVWQIRANRMGGSTAC